MRTQESHRAIRAGLAWNFAHVDASFTQRILGFHRLLCVVHAQDVVADPAVEIIGHRAGGLKAADLVAADDLQIVGKPRCGKNVGQDRRGPRVGVGLVRVVDLGLLGGLTTKEGRVVGAFAVAKRNESEFVELVLTPVGDCDLRRAFERDIALVGFEGVSNCESSRSQT